MVNVNLKIIFDVRDAIDGNNVDHFSINPHQVKPDEYAQIRALIVEVIAKIESIVSASNSARK